VLQYPDIDPVAFQVGELAVRWYGLSYLAGILAGRWLLGRHTRRLSLQSDWTAAELSDLMYLYVPIGILCGGRLGSAIVYYPDAYLDDPLAILRIWEGGMSFHGGLLGAVLAAGWFCRRRGKGFFAVCDLLAPAAPVGLGLGRLANFANGELWGTPSGLPWAMVFPHVDAVARHPSQLYEAVLEGLVLFVLLWRYAGRPRPPMAVSGLFLLGYGCCRFLVEFARAPDAHLGYLAWGWLTMGQALSAPMAVAGAALLLAAYRPRAPSGAGAA